MDNLLEQSELPSRSSIKAKIREENPHILYILSFVIVSLASGLVYGWPALRRNLIDEGTTLDEKTLGIIFTIGAWSTQGGRFFFGIARDRFLGTRITACFSLASAAIGILGFTFSGKDDAILLSISMLFVGLGSGSQLCVQPVAGLFHKKNQGTILASLSGAFQISGLIFLILTAISGNRRRSFGGYSGCLVLLTLITFILLPKKQFIKNDGLDLTDAIKSSNDKETHVNAADNEQHGKSIVAVKEANDENCMNDDAEVIIDETPENENDTHIKNYGANNFIFTKEYIFLLLWFSLIVIPQQYYIATIGLQLERQGDTTSKYTNLFSIIYASVAILGPLFGKIADIFGLGVAQALASVLTSMSLLILSINNNLDYQIIGMICYASGRLWTFANFFSNIGKRFGYKYYGTLAGLGLIISAVISIAQYLLIALAVDGKEFYVNVFSCIGILIVSLPYCAWLGIREKRGKLPIN